MRHAFIALGLVIFCAFSHNAQAMDVSKSQTSNSIEHITQIYIVHPKEALQLLEKAEQQKLIPPARIQELRSKTYSNLYMNRQAYHYARQSFLLDSVSDNNPGHLLKMNVFLAELTNSMSQYESSIRYTRQGMEWARAQADSIAEARLLFCMGENKYALHHLKAAYADFNKAIRLLHKTRNIQQQMTLSHLYGLLMGYLINDMRFQEAKEIGLLREELLHNMTDSPQIPQGFIETQFYYLYAKRAYICQLEKQSGQAEYYYRKCMNIQECQHPGYQIFIVPYLVASKQYDKAINYSQSFRNLMKEQQDTLSVQYLHALRQEVKACLGKQAYKEAAILQGYIIAITDSIDLRNKAISATSLNLPTTGHPASGSTLPKDAPYTFLWSALTAAALVFLIFYSLHRKRRHFSVGTSSPAEEAPSQTAETSAHLSPAPSPSCRPTDAPQSSHDSPTEIQTNQMLFHKLDNLIRKGQLYLQPSVTRSDLVRKLHINNTRFARIIKENTGTNLNGYLNELRLNHAIGLLKEHPEYTLKAIAEASGIHSMPTFHQLFKDKFGMTPAEFKSRLGKDGGSTATTTIKKWEKEPPSTEDFLSPTLHN